jgi:MFS family permease
MYDPKLDQLVHRRPVRVSVGFLAGLLFGPLIAEFLLHAPTSEWLGPYPLYTDIPLFIVAAMMGGCAGPAVGLTVALFVWGVQRWKWRRSESALGRWGSEPEGWLDLPDRRISSDGRILRRTNIRGSMD